MIIPQYGAYVKMKLLEICANDIVKFGALLLNWHAHPSQAKWLRGAKPRESLCRAGHRWGKTESIAIKHLWKCCFKKRHPRWRWDSPYNSINMSLTVDQASLPLRKAWSIISREENEDFNQAFIADFKLSPFPHIRFKNGSIWWGRSTNRKGKNLEGLDFDYASYDEGALDPDFTHIIDEVMRFRLIDRGGQMDCISTGRRGSQFNKRFDEAEKDPNRFTYQGSTLDNPNIDHSALQAILETLDAGLIEERVYGGERPSDGRIPYVSIMRAVQLWNETDWTFSEMKASTLPRHGGWYSTGWDLAETTDYVVGVTWDISSRPFQMVAWEKFNRHTEGVDQADYWSYVEQRIRDRYRIFGGQTVIDKTGMGMSFVGRLANIGAEGLIFTPNSIADLLGVLVVGYGSGVLAHPLLEHPNWQLINEIEELSISFSGLDTITAMALGLYPVREQLREPDIVKLTPKVGGVAR
jgi:hypothetical protein